MPPKMLLAPLFLLVMARGSGAALFDDSTCGVEKTCFVPCATSDCFAAVSFKMLLSNDSAHLEVELYSNAADGYVAFGFNANKAMKGAYVTACAKIPTDSRYGIHFAMTVDASVDMVDDNDAMVAEVISDEEYQVEGSAVYCRFRQKVTNVSSTQLFEYREGVTNYVLLAIGTTSSTTAYSKRRPRAPSTTTASPATTTDRIQALLSNSAESSVTQTRVTETSAQTAAILRLRMHKKKEISDDQLDIKTVANIKKSDTSGKRRLIRAHAIMMVMAWFCFVPTAIFFARFMRDAWPDYKPMGLLIWFHVHRTANLIGILLMIASLICILFAFDWRWTGPGATVKGTLRNFPILDSLFATASWVKPHTAIGLSSIILAFIQPFISAIRCDPKNPRRPYFNWVHRLIGGAALILATTAFGYASYNALSVVSKAVYIMLAVIPFTCLLLLSIFFLVLERNFEVTLHNLNLFRRLRYSSVFVIEIVLVGITLAFCIFIGKSNMA